MQSERIERGRKVDPAQLFDPGRVLCAHGAHGTVLRAAVTPEQCSQIGASVVALKIVALSGAPAQALQRAVERVRSTRCAQLVRYIGAWRTSRNDVWIASELVEGGSARDILALASASSSELEACVAYIAQQTLIALQYLHETCGIAHGGVRASNVLLAPPYTVKLSDYGVYRTLHTALRNRQCYAGARLWAPPEGAAAVSRAADIWAVGVAVVELVDGPGALANTKRSGRRVPRVARPASWSGALNDFVAAAAVADARKRTSAAALLRHRFVAGASGNALAKVLDRALTRPSLPEERCVYRRDDVVENLFRAGDVAMRVPIIEVGDIPIDAFCGKKVRRVSNSAVVEQSLWVVSDALKEMIDTGRVENKEAVVQSSQRVSQWLDIASRRSIT